MVKRTITLAASLSVFTAVCMAGSGHAVVGSDKGWKRASHVTHQPPAPVLAPPAIPAHFAAPHCVTCANGEECIAGVVKHEARDNFPGNGFVARHHPELPCLHTFERAGRPDLISNHAVRNYGPSYGGYYVGGGSSTAHHGATAPCPEDGTFGVDYVGHHIFRHRVALLFNHGAKYQDGTGHYQPDPHREIPNVFAIKYHDRVHRLLAHGGESEMVHE
jgi:hypothetical protein